MQRFKNENIEKLEDSYRKYRQLLTDSELKKEIIERLESDKEELKV